ncbi:MAG: response regulator transcription factor [Nitratireductor sp.]
MFDNQNLTIFIVDDDNDILTSLSRSLTKRGYKVECFISAQQFLDAFNESSQGCLLLDYGMDHINGLELQQLLIEKEISLPIIFMTGHGGIPESVKAIKNGAIDFLEKPFKQDVLIEAIDSAFKQSLSFVKINESKKLLNENLAKLTTREREVAQAIVLNPADTSSKFISRKLGVSPRTVDHHRARILEKMQMNSVVELIEKSIKSELFK